MISLGLLIAAIGMVTLALESVEVSLVFFGIAGWLLS